MQKGQRHDGKGAETFVWEINDIDSQPVVTKVLEPSEDLKNTHTSDMKKVCKSPKRYT
ncbi:unnamed protein product [Ectocarpus sp. CCAP 1310/34]|nr:unnamed protein product [Ectocarpus sp. CCAP 1310/34]